MNTPYNIAFIPLDKEGSQIEICKVSGANYFPYYLNYVPRKFEKIRFDYHSGWNKIKKHINEDDLNLHYDYESFKKILEEKCSSKHHSMNFIDFKVENVIYDITDELTWILIELIAD